MLSTSWSSFHVPSKLPACKADAHPGDSLSLLPAWRRQGSGLPSQHLLPSHCPNSRFLAAAPAKSCSHGAPLHACLSTGGRRTRTRRGFHGVPLLSAALCSMLGSQEKATCLPSPWDQCWKEVWAQPWKTNLMLGGGGQRCWGIGTWEDQEGKPWLLMKESKANWGCLNSEAPKMWWPHTVVQFPHFFLLGD